MTFADLWQILIEAEARRDDETLPLDVRERSGETVSLCKERMAREGLTRDQLKALAFAE
jgi:hypothetical protein